MRQLFQHILSFVIILAAFGSCKKANFLDSKPDQALVVPQSLSDFQAILDNDAVMNGAATNVGLVPSLGEIASDNYYVLQSNYTANMSPLQRNCYIWAQNLYSGQTILDWNLPYRSIFYANEVLDGIKKLKLSGNDQPTVNNLIGSALFYRSHMFYQLAQIFAPPYSSVSSSSDFGVPLQLSADINTKVERASVQATYERILSDLKQAAQLLPVTPLYKTRPSKSAAYGLIARTFLAMADYDNALLYSDSCLKLNTLLIDYNSLLSTSSLPIPRFNDEVIFSSILIYTIPLHPVVARIDSNLYNSYQVNDLRKKIFFNQATVGATYKGSYDGSTMRFSGIATDEIYLIRAECYARKGNTTNALDDLNTLLKTRWATNTFTPFTASTSLEALNIILTERRKELVFRGLRWTDLRRLNKESNFATTLNRVIQGQTYNLSPNDLRYVYPIPDDIINFNPTMPQNPR